MYLETETVSPPDHPMAPGRRTQSPSTSKLEHLRDRTAIATASAFSYSLFFDLRSTLQSPQALKNVGVTEGEDESCQKDKRRSGREIEREE